ncbi:Adenylate cyclase type 1 like [Actinidia chinensis var. chinensis]|uniref:Adenylate cyclase type 1 like n=1 Tax=Actinidia chinensis var. chinensis TaxID=1590841 RepID=A0A2R6Q021_ACTCC|nr:Adenylate cyclase type 1 like [Actinidia chinensis var. chinensis]
MITRSNLAEQLRENQIRSKYDWSSVPLFFSTSNFNSRVDVVIFVIWELIILSFPGVLSCFIIFQAYETSVYLSLHHITTLSMLENYKAS